MKTAACGYGTPTARKKEITQIVYYRDIWNLLVGRTGKRGLSRVEPRYNDIGLYSTPPITSDILWYHLIPQLGSTTDGTTTHQHTGHVTTHYMMHHPIDLYCK
jgi:hypothetical protein